MPRENRIQAPPAAGAGHPTPQMNSESFWPMVLARSGFAAAPALISGGRVGSTSPLRTIGVVYLGVKQYTLLITFLLHLGLVACAASDHLPDRLLQNPQWRRRARLVPGGRLRPHPDRPLSNRAIQALASPVPRRRRVSPISRMGDAPSLADRGRCGLRPVLAGLDRQNRHRV